ncbi:hypothetical protein LCGC14_1230080 [marine sediment metagenome]
MNRENESRLWAKLKSGDIDALNKLYIIHADPLYDYGIKLTRDPESVKDCIHDLFLDLYKYRKKLSKEVNVKYYLLKSLKRKISERSSSKIILLPPDQDFSATIYKDEDGCIEEKIIEREYENELNLSVSNALNGLTRSQLRAISMRFYENRTYEEIAVNMNVSIETARTTIYRAIKTLRHKVSY